MQRLKLEVIENIESVLPLYEIDTNDLIKIDIRIDKNTSIKELNFNSSDGGNELIIELIKECEKEDISEGGINEQIQDIDIIEGVEGGNQLILHIRKERNQQFMKKCKRLFALKDKYMHCEICGFSFYETYGDIGKDFIEGHHMQPISELNIQTKFKSTDILMVCSNCHRMIHREYPCITKERIIDLIKINKL